MKVGLVVDGDSELLALPILLPRIRGTHRVIKTVKADIQPYSSPQNIARKVQRQLPILKELGVQIVVIVLDREKNPQCCGQWSSAIRDAVISLAGGSNFSEFRIVLKNRTFENWLIADQASLLSQKSRFRWRRLSGEVDELNARDLLNRAAIGAAYHKIRDSIRIVKLAEPAQIGSQSRSFRKFLGVLGCAEYRTQTRQAARFPQSSR